MEAVNQVTNLLVEANPVINPHLEGAMEANPVTDHHQVEEAPGLNPLTNHQVEVEEAQGVNPLTDLQLEEEATRVTGGDPDPTTGSLHLTRVREVEGVEAGDPPTRTTCSHHHQLRWETNKEDTMKTSSRW